MVFDTDEGSNIDLDVAFAHPWSSEVLSNQQKKMDLQQRGAKEEEIC